MTSEGAHTKARLLAEARDLYLQGGTAHFSLREVARRAGVSAAAVYRHYDGKEALLAQVCAAGLQVFYGYLIQALAEPTPRDRLASAAEQYLRFATENQADYRVLFMGGAAECLPAPSGAKGTAQAPTFQFLIDRVRECMDAGVLRKGDAQEVAAVIWAHVHGLVSLRLSGHLLTVGDNGHFARFYARSTEHLLAGLSV